MRRYPCNKGELTLIHIRISGTRAQILHRYQKTMVDVKLWKQHICCTLIHVTHINNKIEYETEKENQIWHDNVV